MASNDGLDAVNDASDCGVSSDDIEQTETSVDQEQEVKTADLANEFSTKSWKEDLVLLVEGRKLYVNSGVLALSSTVFSSMLEEAFKNEGPRELELSGRYDDFVEFLRCFYPGIMKPVTMESVMVVAPLAHQYQVENVKKLCEQFLINEVMKSLSPDSFCSVIELASSCQMEDLQKKCTKELTKRDDFNLDVAVNKLHLSPEFRQDILERKIEAVKNEVTILKERLEEKSVRCEELEHIVTKTWSVDLKIEHEKTSEFGMIDMKYNYGLSVSKSMKVKNISWVIKCRGGFMYIDRPEYFYVDVSASGDKSWGKWTCKVQVSCSVSNGNEWSWKKMSHTASAESSGLKFDFGEVDKLKRAWPNGLKVTVCILVGDVLV